MSEYSDRLRTIGVIGKRSRPVIEEGREHPDSGKRWKSVETEVGKITEHSSPGAPGVSDRQDATVYAQTVRGHI